MFAPLGDPRAPTAWRSASGPQGRGDYSRVDCSSPSLPQRKRAGTGRLNAGRCPENSSQTLVLYSSSHRGVSADFEDPKEAWGAELISPGGCQCSACLGEVEASAYFFILCSLFLILLLACAHVSHTSYVKSSQITFSVLVWTFLHTQTHSFSTALCPLSFLPTACQPAFSWNPLGPGRPF